MEEHEYIYETYLKNVTKSHFSFLTYLLSQMTLLKKWKISIILNKVSQPYIESRRKVEIKKDSQDQVFYGLIWYLTFLEPGRSFYLDDNELMSIPLHIF